jgi:hypothetical protein
MRVPKSVFVARNFKAAMLPKRTAYEIVPGTASNEQAKFLHNVVGRS